MQDQDMSSQIVKSLMHIPRLYKIEMSKHFSDIDIFGCQVPMLHYLSKNGGATQRALAEEFRVAAPTMTAMLKRLENAGFIKRLPDQSDARIMRVSLTDKGIVTEQKTKEAFKAIQQELLSGFDDAEKVQFLAYLQRITSSLRGLSD